jgi:flagellar L-ring protein precursor FlgH
MMYRVALLVPALIALSGCTAIDRLAAVGTAPPLSPISDPTAQAGYKPVSLPMPAPTPTAYAPNSLFRNGARGFFKDQRANKVGDILTIKVTITDKAEFDNTTKRSRAAEDTMSIGGVPGKIIDKALPNDLNASPLIGTSGTSSAEGSGSVNRAETLTTNVAAVVTQTLPNGNLVIEGRQEVRVNFEVRELIVAGIIRPEDIFNDNTIDSAKIAEARISYGGRGQITDVQQPRYGNQVLDILLPF